LENRIAIFIDGANLHASLQQLGFDIDYKLLLDFFRGRGSLLRASYYAATVQDPEFVVVRRLLDWLAYNGYTVVTKAVPAGGGGHRRFAGNVGVEMVVDALTLAPYVHQVVLFSGDGDLRPMAAALQRRGIRVTVVSTIAALEDGLRRQADEFLDLRGLRDQIGRTLPESRLASSRDLVHLAAK
jgi:uncharacterized LabA/DUF88 family protein